MASGFRLQAAGEAPSATGEAVQRPDRGLARGRWEAPAWAFWAVAIAAVLGSVAWFALAIRTRRRGERPVPFGAGRRSRP